MFFARPLLAITLTGVFSIAGTGSSDANAQQIFRIVGPDGRITFSDKPPTEPNVKATPAPVVALSSPSAGVAGLPFELRQAAVRFPVTLYTSPECAPCTGGRAMLSRRGIPFTEKTVTTQEDIEALKRLVGGSPALPFLTIGGQHLKGYSETEWLQFLDAAGYPKTSKLPASYMPTPATPLVVAQDARLPVATAPAAPEPPAAAPPPAPEAPNPSGIRF